MSGFLASKTKAEEKEQERKKNQDALGVCRIRRSEGDQKSQTLGSGFVVKDLQIYSGICIPYCLITSDKVFPCDFNIKNYYLDFKKFKSSDLETIKLQDIAAKSTGVHRTFGLVVICINPPSIKKRVKNATVFNWRPFNVASKKIELNKDDLRCHYVDHVRKESFDVQSLKLKYVSGQYELHEDPDINYKTYTEFITRKGYSKPHGAVILKHGCEEFTVAGVLTFTNDERKNIWPVFFPLPHNGLPLTISAASAVNRSKPPEPVERVQQLLQDMGLTPIYQLQFDVREALCAFLKWLTESYSVVVGPLASGSLRVTVQCHTLEHLEQLWNGYCSGTFSEAAEEHLMTDKIKNKLDVEAVELKIEILEEDYLACRQSNVNRFELAIAISAASATSRCNPENPVSQDPVERVDQMLVEAGLTPMHQLDVYLRGALCHIFKWLSDRYWALIDILDPGSLRIAVQCRTVEHLDRLWSDYQLGILNEAAEKYLVTDEIISKLNLEAMKLKTEILEKDYLACRQSLMPFSDFTGGRPLPTEHSYTDPKLSSSNKAEQDFQGTVIDLPFKIHVEDEPPYIPTLLVSPDGVGVGGEKLRQGTDDERFPAAAEAACSTLPQDKPRDILFPLDPPNREEHPQVKHPTSVERQLQLLQPAGGKMKFQLGDPLTKILLGSLELLEELSRCLDQEYRYGRRKCWKHVAEFFGVPEEDYENFKCNQVHSPTEVMFECLQFVTPDITIRVLKDGLAKIGRHDITAMLLTHEEWDSSALNDETLVCSLFDIYPDIIGEMAVFLDKQKPGLKNWSHLAATLGVPRKIFKTFESSSTDNPTEQFFEIVKVKLPTLTVGDLIDHLEAMQRRDVIIAIQESVNVTECSVIKDLIADLEVMDNVCELLNTRKRITKVLGLKHLGKRLGIKKEILDDLLPTQEETQSPTEALIRHLGGKNPSLTLANFIWALHFIDRPDVITVLDGYLPDGSIPNLLKSCDCDRCKKSSLKQSGEGH